MVWSGAALAAAAWCISTGDATMLVAAGAALGLRALMPRERAGGVDAGAQERALRAAMDVEFDLRATLGQLRERFGGAAAERGIALSCEAAPMLPRLVRGDEGALREVLAGLISNAVKFTKHGGVVVRAVADHDDGERIQVCVSVSDTGPGVAQERMHRFFQEFTEGGAALARPSGLVTCKRLVETMGGQIAVASEPGRGATFWFTIVLRRGGACGADARAAVDLRSARVWVASEDAESAGLREMVREAGLNVIDDADVGYAACDILVLVVPRVAEVRDVVAGAAIRAIERPSVVAAVLERVEDAAQAALLRDAGIDAFVQLPVDEAHLADALATACGACRRAKAA